MSPTFARLRAFGDRVWLALLWRYGCHSTMLLVVLFAERLPAPTLPDRVLALTPYVPLIARFNYHLWILAYVPLALWFWRIDRRGFVSFLYVGGLLSLLRGLTIAATGLGPVHGDDVNAGLPIDQLIAVWVRLVNPVSALTSSVAHVHLTKDLFFSGHTSSTFLLWLYVRRIPRLGPLALVGHLFVVSTVFLSHLHYTIDVVGGWAITFATYVIFQGWPSRILAELGHRSSPPGAHESRGAEACSDSPQG